MDNSGWTNEVVTVAALTGHDKDGKPTYGSQSTRDVLIERRQKRVRNSVSGKEVISDTQLMSEVEIKATSRVWLPEADTTKTNQARTVTAVSNAKSRVDGRQVFEVFL